MGSVAVIYIPSFIKIDSGIQKLVVGGAHKHAFIFFRNNEISLKRKEEYEITLLSLSLCVCVCVFSNSGILEPEETAVARQIFSKRFLVFSNQYFFFF
jgi:hypothetical protein